MIGAQPGGGRGDFAGLAEAVQRDVAGDLGPGCLVGALQVVGEDRAGGYCVDPDSLSPVVERGGLGWLSVGVSWPGAQCFLVPGLSGGC